MGTELMPWTRSSLDHQAWVSFYRVSMLTALTQLRSEASSDLQGKGHCYQDGSASYKMHPIKEVTSSKVSHGQRTSHKWTKTNLN